LAVLVGVAGADVIATRVRTSAFTLPFDACPGAGCPLVPLTNGASSTSAIFVTIQDNQRVVIEYNAECTVEASNNSTYLTLTILGEGTAAAPSSTDKAHCTSDRGGPSWVSAVATAVVVPEPGIHRVQIQAQIIGGVAGDNARIDDTTLVVMK
jgi:hypothetical protein